MYSEQKQFVGKPEMTMLVILGLVVALTFAVVQRKSNLGATPFRYGWRNVVEGFETASRNALSIIVACATAGILIGVITTSGLSTKFTRIVVGFSETLTNMLPTFMVTDNTQLYFTLVLTVFCLFAFRSWVADYCNICRASGDCRTDLNGYGCSRINCPFICSLLRGVGG